MKRPLPPRKHVSPRRHATRAPGPIAPSPFRPLASFAHSPKAVPFSANVYSISGTKIEEQRTSILSGPKILHHEFLLEKHPKIRGGKGSKKQRGITAA
jgi:hypothetical protein